MSTAQRLYARRMLRRLVQQGTRSTATCRYIPRFEPLESRRLLTVAPFDHEPDAFNPYSQTDPTPSWAGAGAAPIVWEGTEAYARRSEWIVQFEQLGRSLQEQVDHIQQRLDEADFSAYGLPSPRDYGVKVTDHLGADGLVVLTAADNELEFEELREPLSAIGGVEYVEPNFVGLQQASTFPDDTYFSSLYGLHNIGQFGGNVDADVDAPEVWDISTGSQDLVVAVIDSGIDYNHPDLAANIWVNPGEIAGNGIDDDANGYVDDIHGYDFYNNDSDPWDDRSHGTHVAGTIGAVGNNAQGVTGVNWNIQMMPIKFLGPLGTGTTAGAVQAVNYATMMRRDYGINVVLTNNSWGGGGYSTALRNAIEASGNEDMLFIAAAGNDYRNTDISPNYPSGYKLDNIISVAATNRHDQRPAFSNYGATSVDLGAPGVSTFSTVPGGGYGFKSGTSMAAPHVAGVAALAWSMSPQSSYAEIRDAIYAGVDPVPSMAGITVTGGRLSAFNTLEQLGTRVETSSPSEGEIITAPSMEFTVTFSSALGAGSVDADDLTVNGIAADTVQLSDVDTVVFSYANSPVASQGLQAMAIAGGAVTVGGRAVQGWNARFRYDALPMEVVSTTPASNSVTLLPLHRVEIHLNEPYDPATVAASDLQISHGSVVGYELLDEDSIVFLVEDATEEEHVTMTLDAGALADVYGNPMGRFDGAFDLDVGTMVYPTPFEPTLPANSMVSSPKRNGVIGVAGDRDTFTISVDPGQKLTIAVSTDQNLHAAVEITPPEDGDAQPVSAVASAAGETVLLQDVPTRGRLIGDGPGAATYSITVSGEAASTGNYTLQVILNAAVESEARGGTNNGSAATAQSLASAFLPIAHAVDDTDEDETQPYRAAVLGRLDGGRQATAPSQLETTEGNYNNAWPFHIGNHGHSSMRYQQIYAATEFDGQGLIDELRFRRNGNALTLEPTELDVQINLSYAATGVDTISRTFAENIGSGYTTVFDGLLTLESVSSGYPKPFDIIADVDDVFHYDPERGDLLVEVRMRNAARTRYFDASISPQHQVTNRAFAFDANAETGFAATDVPVGLVTQFGFVEDEDWYSFEHNAGESATVAVTGLDGGDVTLDLFSADGTLLARGVPDPTNVGEVIGNFSAGDTAGTYYVRVTGAGGTEYSLLVTRNAEIEQEGNDDIASAHDLLSSQAAGRRWVMGHLGEQDQRLFAVPRDGSDTIVEIDPVTGAEIARIPAPMQVSGMADALAFDGESLFFMNSWRNEPVLWQLDPNTGAVLDSDMIATGSESFDGLAALGGKIYINDYLRNDIVIFDPVTDTVTSTLDVDGLDPGVNLLGGLTAAKDPNVLIALDTFGADVLTIDPDTGEVLSSFVVGGVSVGGAAVIGNEIYLGRSAGNTADVYSRDGVFQRTVGLSVSVSGFGAAAVPPNTDFYAVAVDGNKTLMVQTYTPGDGSGELVSDLDPMIRIYDSAGELVAADDNSSPDGRNAKASYRVPREAAGTYYVQILPSDSTAELTGGEYVLSVKHASGDLPPFEATVVAPPDRLRTRDVPTQVTVDYNDNILLTTVDPADLSVAGIEATDVTIVDGNTLAFDLPSHALHWAADDGGNGHYYLLPPQHMNWQETEQYAATLGGHLVSINDEQEQQFLQHYFLSGNQQRTAYWIGLTDQDVNGTFRWTSGEPVSYTNWHPGEPNDWGAGEDYAVINWHFANGNGTPPGTWNDSAGSERRLGIIELPALPEGVWLADDGVHSFTTAAGAMADVQNTPLAEFSSQIELDLTAPRVVSASPQPDGVVAPGDVDVVISFSESMATGTLDPSATVLQGLLRAETYLPNSVQWDASGTTLTLSYSSLLDDRYALTLPSGASGLKDLIGWQLDGEGSTLPSGDGFEGGDFLLTFAVDPSGAVDYPTPLEAKAPMGSLIYDPSATGTIAFPGDSDDYTLDIDPGQALTVAVRAPGDLRPSVELIDPSGSVLGTSVAGAPGDAAVVQVPAADGGTYTIRLGGDAGSVGLYTVETVLNADVERELYGEENNSITTAQSLEPSFIPLLKGTDRGAVLGSADGMASGLGPDGFGYMASDVPFEFEDVSTTGTAIPTFYRYSWWQSRNDGYAPLSDAQLGDFEFEFYGQTYNNLYVSTNGLLTFGSGESYPYNSDLRYYPYRATIAAFWDDLDLTYGGGEVYWDVRGTGNEQQLIVQWDNVRFSPSWSWQYTPMTFQAVLSEADNSIQFNYLDLSGGSFWQNEGGSATVGIKDAAYQTLAGSDRLLVSYNNASSPYVGTGTSVRIAVPNSTADYYSVELNAGDKITVVATALDSGTLAIELVDGSSTTLATGTAVGTNVDSAIANFEAPVGGTYYVRVTGDLGADYSLVVTRNAVFDTEGNSSLASAQDFAGLNVALGHVGGPASAPGTVRVAVHANDGDWVSNYYAQHVMNQLSDSATYDFTATLATNDQLDTVAELGAYDVVVLGSRYWTSFPLNVAQSLRQWVQSGKGGLVATGSTYRQLASYSTAAVRQELDPVIPLDLSHPYVVSALSPVTVTDANHPVTAGIETIAGYFPAESSYRGADPDAHILAIEGSSSRRPAVTVSNASGGRTVHLAPWYSGHHTLRMPGSAGDRLLEQAVAWAAPPGLDDADIYFFTAAAGETLDLFTVTPADGPGEFINTLDPRLTLYDASGNVVATGVPTADGRNEQILYTVPDGAQGTYRIAVTAENGTAGEYILDPISVVVSTTAPISTESLATLDEASLLLPAAESDELLVNSGMVTDECYTLAIADGWQQIEEEEPLEVAVLDTEPSRLDLLNQDESSPMMLLADEENGHAPDTTPLDEEPAIDDELVDTLFADEAFLHQLWLS